MGKAFKPYAKEIATELLWRMKEKKAIEQITLALNKMYGPALALHDVFGQIHDFMFPKKNGTKMPPHSQIGGLEWVAQCIEKEKKPLNSSENGDVTKLCLTVVTKFSDPKVRNEGFIIEFVAQPVHSGQDGSRHRAHAAAYL